MRLRPRGSSSDIDEASAIARRLSGQRAAPPSSGPPPAPAIAFAPVGQRAATARAGAPAAGPRTPVPEAAPPETAPPADLRDYGSPGRLEPPALPPIEPAPPPDEMRSPFPPGASEDSDAAAPASIDAHAPRGEPALQPALPEVGGPEPPADAADPELPPEPVVAEPALGVPPAIDTPPPEGDPLAGLTEPAPPPVPPPWTELLEECLPLARAQSAMVLDPGGAVAGSAGEWAPGRLDALAARLPAAIDKAEKAAHGEPMSAKLGPVTLTAWRADIGEGRYTLGFVADTMLPRDVSRSVEGYLRERRG